MSNSSELAAELQRIRSAGIVLPRHPGRAVESAREMKRMVESPGQMQKDLGAMGALERWGRGPTDSPELAAIHANNAALKSAMGGSRRLGSMRKTAGEDVAIAIPRFYDPLEYWDLSGLPWNMADEGHRHKLHKWLRLYYATHRLVPSLIDIFTRYPLIGLDLPCSDKKIGTFYEELFLDQLHYEDFLVKLGREHWTVGEAYPLGSFNEALGVWEREELLNPEDIVIENFPMLGTRQIKVVPPEYLPLSVETKVSMADGTRKRLGDIEIGDEILTHIGRSACVEAVHEQGLLSGVRIITESGRAIDSALEHPFLTPTGWVTAEDLRVGDVLGAVVPKTITTSSVRSLEEFRLAGYFCGDGNSSWTRKDGLPGSCAANIRCFDDLQAEDIFDVGAKLGFVVNPVKGKTKGKYGFSAGENSIQDWLKDPAVGLAGKICYTKRVPPFVFEGDNQQVANFIGAYFATDGTLHHRDKVRKDMQLSFTSVSREMLEDVQHLLMRFGVRSKLHRHDVRSKRARNNKRYRGGVDWQAKLFGNDVHTQTSFLLLVSSQDDFAKFVDAIKVYGVKHGRLDEWRYGRSAFDKQILEDLILAIEPLEAIDCRCLTVSRDSSFLAEGLAVHNTRIATTKSPPEQYKQLEDNFPELLPYLKRGEPFPVSETLLKQVAFKVTDWDDHGTPILLRGLRTLLHEEKLLASQDAIAERLYSPLILAKLGIEDMGDNYGPWIPGADQLESFRDDMDMALAADFRMMVYHYGLTIENVFGREQMPDLGNDFDRVGMWLMQIFGLQGIMATGSYAQPYATSALNAEFMNQMLRTYQYELKRHMMDRMAVVAEAQGHYAYTKKGQTRVPIMEEVVEWDENGDPHIVEKHKLLFPEPSFQSLDIRDEATQRQFMQSLRAQGVPISDEKMMVGVDFKFEDSLDEMYEETIQKTVAQQMAKLQTYKILRAQGLTIPPALQAEIEGTPAAGPAGGPGGAPGGAGGPGGMPGGGGGGMAGPGGLIMPPPPAGLSGRGLPYGPMTGGPHGMAPGISSERMMGMPGMMGGPVAPGMMRPASVTSWAKTAKMSDTELEGLDQMTDDHIDQVCASLQQVIDRIAWKKKMKTSGFERRQQERYYETENIMMLKEASAGEKIVIDRVPPKVRRDIIERYAREAAIILEGDFIEAEVVDED